MVIKLQVPIIFAFGVTILSSDAHANIFCDRPTKPSIPNSYYADHDRMKSTQREVKTYSEQMRRYLECVAREHEDGISEHRSVMMEWENTVRAFNHR